MITGEERSLRVGYGVFLCISYSTHHSCRLLKHKTIRTLASNFSIFLLFLYHVFLEIPSVLGRISICEKLRKTTLRTRGMEKEEYLKELHDSYKKIAGLNF